MPEQKRTFEFSKRTVAPGWAEIRVITPRSVPDTEDYQLAGTQARLAIAQFICSSAAGIAHQMGKPELEPRLKQLWAEAADALSLIGAWDEGA